ncbi:late competence protein ComER [Halobacillus shinanisalinarum]|uniref:Pyrroline-5-carboxylate reductase n=1 Tax=Halobacillus shinanisalinarum TaxID=2932258 RepID=A0ABY4H1L1_9BACI|nr:late competence protein ComER [Halobacillus shinanisalinarum]UOQ93800.1 late competence protein ComER [Halobacillus shinanisalinarum]
MRYGIIGTGNMGSMLANAFISSGAVDANDLTIYNRTRKKAEWIKNQFKEITIADSVEEVARDNEVIFICVKPHDYKDILSQCSPTATQCLVSITSPVSVDDLERVTSCQIARVVPSITNRAFSGVSLFTYGERISNFYKEELLSIFSHISTPIEIEEESIRSASDIVSCGPAFISFLLENMITAAQEVGGMSKDKATQLTEEMMIGLGTLLEKRTYTLPELMEKVTVKGGVTGEGIRALEENVGDLFQEMFQATHRKHKDDKRTIHF